MADSIPVTAIRGFSVMLMTLLPSFTAFSSKFKEEGKEEETMVYLITSLTSNYSHLSQKVYKDLLKLCIPGEGLNNIFYEKAIYVIENMLIAKYSEFFTKDNSMKDPMKVLGIKLGEEPAFAKELMKYSDLIIKEISEETLKSKQSQSQPQNQNQSNEKS